MTWTQTSGSCLLFKAQPCPHLVHLVGADPPIAPEPGALHCRRRQVPSDHMSKPKQQREAHAERAKPAEGLSWPGKVEQSVLELKDAHTDMCCLKYEYTHCI